ncbi:DUF2059 domain-containing protein [Maribacter sp. 2-571]|uniref:DUF2059 domain-containing protein n=1 Tax=Maribacter sp. 2-571 TaxID=3417569 RepID=UPI003D3331CB
MSIVKITIRLTIPLLFLTLSTGLAQSDGFDDAVMAYLDSNGTVSQYQNAYTEFLNLLENQFPETENNKKGWQFLRSEKSKAVHQIKELLVPIYQNEFTREDIRLMTAFYNSDAGIQWRTDRSQMTEKQKEDFNTFYKSDLGNKIKGKQAVLAKQVSAVSESWSRDLYETARALLKPADGE